MFAELLSNHFLSFTHSKTIDSTPNVYLCWCVISFLFSQVKNILLEHAFEVSSFLFFVGPMTLICVLYVLIGVKLRKSKLLQGVKRRGCEFGRGISGQTRVIRMLGKFIPFSVLICFPNEISASTRCFNHLLYSLYTFSVPRACVVAVAVAFFLCWAPFHAQRLMAVYGKTSSTPMSCIFRRTYTVLTYVSGVLYFMSTCINPLLYSIMSHKFRDAFKVSLFCMSFSPLYVASIFPIARIGTYCSSLLRDGNVFWVRMLPLHIAHKLMCVRIPAST